MATLTLPTPRDALLPRAPGGNGRGLLLALLAHALLIVALSFGIDWHASDSPDAAEAELWAAVPQAVAPRAAVPTPQPATPPPPPPPTPAPTRAERPTPVPVERPAAARELPDAQIAIEQRKRREQQQQQQQREADEQQAKKKAAAAAADRARQQAADAAAAKARDAQKAADARREKAEAAKQIEAQSARIEKQRQDNLKRLLGEAGGSGAPTATGTAAQSAGPSADYVGRIKGRIRPNVSFPNILDGNPAVEVEVRIAPDGRILSSRVVKKSGAPEWDDAVLRAIDKTEVLPRDENGRVPPVMTIVYRPRD